MSRINRRNWTNRDVGYMSSGGLFDMFDNAVKTSYRITDAEFDHLCEVMTDEEGEVFTEMSPTFAQRRQMLQILAKYITYE